MQREWRDIPGFPNYQVSSDGQARSTFNGVPRVLTPRVRKGYYAIHAIIGGKDRNIGIHRAICLAFHGDPPKGFVAAHRDGNRLHNTVNNLRWASQSENALDRAKHGRPYAGSGNPNKKLSSRDVLSILESSESNVALARQFGVSRNQIWRIRKGHCWNVDVTTLRDEAERRAA